MRMPRYTQQPVEQRGKPAVTTSIASASDLQILLPRAICAPERAPEGIMLR